MKFEKCENKHFYTKKNIKILKILNLLQYNSYAGHGYHMQFSSFFF